jgi:hypothetical protein
MSRLSRQCEILNILQPYRPPRPVTGIALLFFLKNVVWFLRTSGISLFSELAISPLQNASFVLRSVNHMLTVLGIVNHKCWSVLFPMFRSKYNIPKNIHSHNHESCGNVIQNKICDFEQLRFFNVVLCSLIISNVPIHSIILNLDCMIRSHLKPRIAKVSFNHPKSRLYETHVCITFLSGFVIWEALIIV